MELNQLASAIINDLFGGNLVPLSERSLISVEQIEDEVIAERALILKEWYIKSILSPLDMAITIDCVAVDCKDPSDCPCQVESGPDRMKHFTIPKLMEGLGTAALIYVGPVDKSLSYSIYTSREAAEYHQYKRFKANDPYVYINPAPNKDGLYDGWIFNAPFVDRISVIGVFADPRQIKGDCGCPNVASTEMGDALSSEILKRILARKVNLYRTAVSSVAQSV